jgi:hypothetical protein
VVCICEGDHCPDLVTEILVHGTIEILGIVDGDLLRYFITTDDVLLEKFLDGGGGYIGYRFCFNPFGEGAAVAYRYSVEKSYEKGRKLRLAGCVVPHVGDRTSVLSQTGGARCVSGFPYSESLTGGPRLAFER